MNWNSPDLRGRRQLGLTLFLASLAVLFGASIAAFAYLRLTSPALQGSERMELPLVLGVSTVVLLGAGLAMYKATQNARRGHFPLLRRWLAWAWVDERVVYRCAGAGADAATRPPSGAGGEFLRHCVRAGRGSRAARGGRDGAVVGAGVEGAHESAR